MTMKRHNIIRTSVIPAGEEVLRVRWQKSDRHRVRLGEARRIGLRMWLALLLRQLAMRIDGSTATVAYRVNVYAPVPGSTLNDALDFGAASVMRYIGDVIEGEGLPMAAP